MRMRHVRKRDTLYVSMYRQLFTLRELGILVNDVYVYGSYDC